MKKELFIIILLLLMLTLSSCSYDFECTLDVYSDSNVKLYEINEQKLLTNKIECKWNEDYPFVEFYDNIDFEECDKNPNEYPQTSVTFAFGMCSNISKDVSMTLRLKEANTYLLDFIRIGIKTDNEIRFYQVYKKSDNYFGNKNKPKNIEYFKTDELVFENIEIYLEQNVEKVISVYIWCEEQETLNVFGKEKFWLFDKKTKIGNAKLELTIE